MRPHTQAALRTLILKDLRVGQSTADSIAGRLKIDTQTCEQVCAILLAENHVETARINEALTVYRATTLGLQSILP
jgi:hypothetical protein